MEFVNFDVDKYPMFQTKGNSAQFAIPFAKHVCIGNGYDIGCNRLEWAFQGAKAIDLSFNDGLDAMNLPPDMVDYIFSSHCLEHIDRWVDVLDYWISKLKIGGTLFLYLPDMSQKYWRPWNNRRHLHVFTPDIIKSYLETKLSNVFVSGIDLNNSFMAFGEKQPNEGINNAAHN